MHGTHDLELRGDWAYHSVCVGRVMQDEVFVGVNDSATLWERLL